MIDWASTYSTEFQVYEVDQDTWDDTELIEDVQALDISRDATDDVPLIETGSMEREVQSIPSWAWYRIYMIAAQGGHEKIPIATMMFERGSRHDEYQFPVWSLTGSSVLKPVADVSYERGGYAPAGIDGAQFVADVMRSCLPRSVPITIDGGFTINDNVVFDIDIKCLEVVWKVLDAANWCLRIDGRGGITISEKPSLPDLVLDRANSSILIPGIDQTLDLRGVPNRYTAVLDNQTAVATNEDPDLLGSYPNRGRWIDHKDTSPILINGEDLQAYAERKLREVSTVYKEYKYTRDFWPDVVPFSLVRGNLPETDLVGDLRVLSHSCTFGKGILFSETSGIEVQV